MTMTYRIPLLKIALMVITLSSHSSYLQAQGNEIEVRGIPFPLEIYNSPLAIEVKGDSVIALTSKGKTNLYNSPGDNYYKQDAPMILFHPDSNFVFSAKVRANLKEVYDVAALVLYQNRDLWAKLCFENSVDKRATVVSVVTQRYSDDCNSIEVDDSFIYLSIAKKGDELSFHCSRDGRNWDLVRHFRLTFDHVDMKIGFAVHGSRGDHFSAEFSDISYTPIAHKNMRKYKQQ